jgi:hypothetical protein
MKLSKNSFNTKLYVSTFGDHLPESICAFFWKSLLSWIFLLPAWPGHLINKLIINLDDKVKAYRFIFHVPLFMAIGIPNKEYFHVSNRFILLMLYYCYGAIILFLVISIIVLIASGIGYVIYRVENIKKNCSKIEWVD